jgi:hypothetical protein
MSEKLRDRIQGSVSSCCECDNTGCAALFQHLYGSSCSDWLWLLIPYTGPFSKRNRPASRQYHNNCYNGTGAHTKTETLFHYTDTLTLYRNAHRSTQLKIYRRLANTVCCFVCVLSNIKDGEQI